MIVTKVDGPFNGYKGKRNRSVISKMRSKQGNCKYIINIKGHPDKETLVDIRDQFIKFFGSSSRFLLVYGD
jgi:hypothetical protein